MPQLKSGRHFGITASGFMEVLQTGSDRQKTAMIMAYRLQVQQPEDLRDHLRVVYFEEGTGIPPNAASYDSGYSVGNIFSGESDWSDTEITELKSWLDTNPQLNGWLKQQFDEINTLIQSNPVWESSLWTED